MAHHKRRKPKNSRAGCLMCKYWKMNGWSKNRSDRMKFSDYIKHSGSIDQMKEI